MREIIILIIVAASSLFLLGYSIHMLIGGLVSAETEKTTIIIALIIGACVLAFLGYDIFNTRRKQ